MINFPSLQTLHLTLHSHFHILQISNVRLAFCIRRMHLKKSEKMKKSENFS